MNKSQKLTPGKSRNIVGITNKSLGIDSKLPPLLKTQFPYEVPRTIEKLTETSHELNKPYHKPKSPEKPKRIYNSQPSEAPPSPPTKHPLEILASEDEEAQKNGEGLHRTLFLEPQLLRETAERIQKTSYFPLTQSQAEAITRKQVEQKLIKLSGYFVETNDKKYKYMKDGFRNLDRTKSGHITLHDFIEVTTKSGLCTESEASLLFHTQDVEKKGFIRFDQFIQLLDTEKLNKPRFFQVSDIHLDPKTVALRKRGEVVKVLIFDRIRQQSKSRKDYRSNSDVLLSIFRQMDYRRDGFLTYNDVKDALGPKILHLDLTDQEVYDLCRSIDITGTGTIDFVSWFCEMGEIDVENGYDPFYCGSNNVLQILKLRTQQKYDPTPNKHIYTGIVYPQNGQELTEDNVNYLNPPRTHDIINSQRDFESSSNVPLGSLTVKFNNTKNEKLFLSTVPQRNESLDTLTTRNREFIPSTRYSARPNSILPSYRLGLSHFPKYSSLASDTKDQFLTTNQIEYQPDRTISKSDERKIILDKKLSWAQQKYNHYQDQMEKSQTTTMLRDDNIFKGKLKGRIQLNLDYNQTNYERNYFTQLNERVNPHQDKINKFYQVSPNSMFSKTSEL